VRGMTSDDVSVITLDGHIHSVVEKTPIVIHTQQGTIGQVSYADPNDPETIMVADGRTSFQVSSAVGHRYRCSCGLGFDATDSSLDSDSRFIQGLIVDCPNC